MLAWWTSSPRSRPRATYDDYGYGLQHLFSYPSAVGISGVRAQVPGGDVAYLMGEADTGTDNLNVDPEAMLQGANRFERAQIHYAHLRDHFGPANLPRHALRTRGCVGGVIADPRLRRTG